MSSNEAVTSYLPLEKELHICCKKALHARKNAGCEEDENEPSWICVVVDILISLLSRNSNPLRSVVTSVFPMFCPFINEDALKQILDVINPEKAEDDAMLVDESGGESDAEFDSGSSSSEEESDSIEQKNSKVDEVFRRKVKEALGAAAEVSDAESIVLSDSEMFKMDDALAEAFKSRVQTGHTQLKDKDKVMLNFRVRCLDLIMEFLKSDPPMHLVMLCIQPVLAAYEYGHKGRLQNHLLSKAISTLQLLTRIKKFQNQDNVDKSQIKELLKSLMAKCHKERNLVVAKKLYSVCVFLVLCFRRIETSESPSKKTKKSSYLKIYLSALEAFVRGSSSHAYPQLFVSLMEACPELAWSFIQPCQQYAFDDSVRIYKKTQCFGLIFEALKYSKGQTAISAKDWLEVGNNFMSQAVETLKSISEVKPAKSAELLNVVFSFYCIVKDKTGQDYGPVAELLECGCSMTF
ncbi:hypothetical protein JTE90_022359 [Oedothorax gibbosus]|uniref:DNA polymerase V n=1 Tax=Oedothorax gibbosus TaxID=931172 RepID=A0AAV6UMG6_9ARAC|nr:hypothetical protein JTE90_022359 [Oedothorax gibbosus]